MNRLASEVRQMQYNCSSKPCSSVFMRKAILDCLSGSEYCLAMSSFYVFPTQIFMKFYSE